MIRPNLRLRCILAACLVLIALPVAAAPVHVVALGDSLTAGLGLPAQAAFPAKLQAALRAKGYDVEVSNAGVSGDTAAGGLARLDWSVPPGTDAVILELGANDMLRGLDPKTTREALSDIVARLKARGIPVLIAGMQAAPNLGPDYTAAFDSIYPDLARRYGTLLYPFFLAGIVAGTTLDPAYTQPDGMHPNAAGVDVIVAHILPSVEALIARAKAHAS